MTVGIPETGLGGTGLAVPPRRPCADDPAAVSCRSPPARSGDGCGRSAPIPPSAHPAEVYEPAFFSGEEWRFLAAAVDTIVPPDEELGYAARRIPAFIDRRLASPFGSDGLWRSLVSRLDGVSAAERHRLREEPTGLYRQGIEAAGKAFLEENGCRFAEASDAARGAFLFRLAAGTVSACGLSGRAFLLHLLADIRSGRVEDR